MGDKTVFRAESIGEADADLSNSQDQESKYSTSRDLNQQPPPASYVTSRELADSAPKNLMPSDDGKALTFYDIQAEVARRLEQIDHEALSIVHAILKGEPVPDVLSDKEVARMVNAYMAEYRDIQERDASSTTLAA